MEIIKHTSLDPGRLLRFLQNEKETRTLAEYLQKIRGLTTYIRPKDRDKKWHESENFLSHQLWLQDRKEGGIAGCVERIRKRRHDSNLTIPQLDWIIEPWDL